MRSPRHLSHSPGIVPTLSLLVVLAGSSAFGAGLYLPVHGVRALGRGGAFLAGGDDVGALWYNPANLDLCGNQTLAELAVVMASQSYARVDSGGNRLPSVSSSGEPMTIPHSATALRIGKRLTLGLGFSAPYAALPRYSPDGPQRYSLIDLDGTFIARVEAAVSYRVYEKPNKRLQVSVGVSLQDTVLNFESRSVLNACPGTVVTAPEDSQCDARSMMKLSSVFNPSASVGVHVAAPWWRAAAAFQLPTWVSGEGQIESGIPTHPLFRHLDGSPKAYQDGDQAHMSFNLPWILRLGVEVRPTRTTRVELEFDYEGWSMHDAIRIEPHNVVLRDLNGGVPEYDVGDIMVWRGFNDAASVRLGFEWDLHRFFTGRAGFGYETGAPPTNHLSVITMDMAKELVSLGATWNISKRWRADIGYAHVFEHTTTVPLQSSPTAQNAACQISPIRPGGACIQVNAGTYDSGYDVVGAAGIFSF